MSRYAVYFEKDNWSLFSISTKKCKSIRYQCTPIISGKGLMELMFVAADIDSNRVHIIMPDCYSKLSELGLWKLLASSELKFEISKNKDDNSNQISGLAIADPPTIVSISLGTMCKKTKNVVVFLDIRNFAIEEKGKVNNDNAKRFLSEVCDFMTISEGGYGIKPSNTVASMGFYAAKKHGALVNHGTTPNEASQEICRKSYYSGRVEAYQVGENIGIGYMWDLSRAYMRTATYGIMPGKFSRMYYYDNCMEPKLDNDEIITAADVIIDTNVPAMPLRIDKRLIWPIGVFRTFIAAPEFELAKRLGIIRKINRVVIHKIDYCLSEWSAKILKKSMQYEAQGNLYAAKIGKIIFNATIGKIGGNYRKWKGVTPHYNEWTWGYWHGTDPETGEICEYRNLGGIVEYCHVEPYSLEFDPIVPGIISSYVRSFMFKIIQKIGRENVWYISNDGLVVNEIGHRKLKEITNGKHDDMYVLREKGEPGNVTIKCIGVYRVGDHIVGPKMSWVKDDGIEYIIEREREVPINKRIFGIGNDIANQKTIKMTNTKRLMIRNVYVDKTGKTSPRIVNIPVEP